MYINDLPEAVKSEVYLFADNTKILQQITSRDDAVNLQSDIDSLELWTNERLLPLQIPRSHLTTMRLTAKPRKQEKRPMKEQ